MSLVTASAYVLSRLGWAALTAQHGPAMMNTPASASSQPVNATHVHAGAALVAFRLPKRDAERDLLAVYATEDRSSAPRPAAPSEPAPAAG